MQIKTVTMLEKTWSIVSEQVSSVSMAYVHNLDLNFHCVFV